jgi:cell division protein FtsQ
MKTKRKNRKVNKHKGVSPFKLEIHWIALIGPIFFSALFYFSSDEVVMAVDLPISEIALIGQLNEVIPRDIEDIILSEEWLGFFSTDINSIQNKIYALPWVYQVRASKLWPNRINIEIIEQTPIARWGESSLINDEGQHFPVANIYAYDYLPRIYGPVGTESQIHNAYKALIERAMTFNLIIDELEMTDRGSWKISLSDNKLIYIGKESLDMKSNLLFETVIPSLMNIWSEVQVIDLRYQNGFSVKFNEENFRFSNT